MGYRIRFATCHGQYRSVHCHRVDRQALNYDKIKMSLYGNTATFLVRLTGFEPAAFRVGAERSIQLSYNRTFMKIVAGTRSIV